MILITIVKRLEKKFSSLESSPYGSSVCNSENVFTLSVCFSPCRLETFTVDN